MYTLELVHFETYRFSIWILTLFRYQNSFSLQCAANRFQRFLPLKRNLVLKVNTNFAFKCRQSRKARFHKNCSFRRAILDFAAWRWRGFLPLFSLSCLPALLSLSYNFKRLHTQIFHWTIHNFINPQQFRVISKRPAFAFGCNMQPNYAFWLVEKPFWALNCR